MMTTRFIILSLFLQLISAGSSSVLGKLETTFLQADRNSVISPYSIASTLLPLKLGSDGKTRIELEKALEGFEFGNVQKVKNEKSSISSTTLLLASKEVDLLPEFKSGLNGINVETIEGFDFRDYQFINDYVKNSTGGLIQNIVNERSFSRDTKLVIVNGVYFESPWRTPFQATLRSMPFTSLSGSVTEISMMYQKSSNYYSKVNELGATVLELPYKSLDKVMRIYLPFSASGSGLPELLKNLQRFNTSSIRFKLTELEVYLPKFKIENEIRLTNGLDELGLRSVTKPTADFRKMSTKPLRVDEIISKSVIEVTQTGTKAGSATAIFIIPLSGFTAEEFIANRPFYFEIRGVDSKNIYFSGTYTNPEPSNAVAPFNTDFDIANRENIGSDTEIPNPTADAPWWVHTGRPEYLLVPKPNPDESTPRFQQPEPLFPSGIRFLFPSKDPNGQFVIESHLKNVTNINSIIL